MAAKAKRRKRCTICSTSLDDKNKCPKVYYDHATAMWKHGVE